MTRRVLQRTHLLWSRPSRDPRLQRPYQAANRLRYPPQCVAKVPSTHARCTNHVADKRANAATPHCNALYVAVSDDPLDGAFDGLYTLDSNKIAYSRSWWDVLQHANDQNVFYSRTQWIINGEGDGALSCESNERYPSEVGADAQWTHLSVVCTLRVNINCIATASPTSPRSH